ncbi:MAG: GAF domain-containing protein [Bacteriovoracaceae bacterium]|jgi:L-methionine (R)-S-oxide reductase
MWILQSNYSDIETFYPTLKKELHSLVEGEKNLIANLANISSWIYHSMPELNWSGFYLWNEQDQELILGPFQGKPACIRIKPQRGVCGASYLHQKVMRVDDVHAFPGHIACDGDSRSELVIPLLKDNKVIGVLDLDSPRPSRFSQRDEKELTEIMREISLKIL